MNPSSLDLDSISPEGNPLIEVADIFRAHGDAHRSTHALRPEQLRAMRDIERCRTPIMGGHVEVCEQECGYLRVSYNSCRNRHCPKCQGLRGLQWLEDRVQRLLPTHYFHLVITLPHEFNPLVLYNSELLLGMLFQAASRALLDYALSWPRLGAQIGFTAILHTWNQELAFHPHLHIIASGGGLHPSGTRWIASRLNFLVPVKGLSLRFRGLFCDTLQEAFDQGKLRFPPSMAHLDSSIAFRRFLRKRRRHKWTLYCKKPFGGPEQFLSYVARYTHRVAISNHRLLGLSDGRVTFKARDNRNPKEYRTVILAAQEFIRRFLLHILPPGFVKIRHYGLMAPGNVNTRLKAARALIVQSGLPAGAGSTPGAPDDSQSTSRSWWERFRQLARLDPNVCPKCGARIVRKSLSHLESYRAFMQEVAMNSP